MGSFDPTPILEQIPTDDVMLVRLAGNIGDRLIDAGTDALLGRSIFTVDHYGPCPGRRTWHSCRRGACPTREFGGTLVISGGGAWNRNFHDPISIVRRSKAQHVVVLPSSYDVNYAPVRAALRDPRLVLLAREHVSAQIPGAILAPCPSLFFDYEPFRKPGYGRLNAYRTDAEAAGGPVPDGNRDISVECESLEEWLSVIAAAEEVCTDRAHVMIAAALLGKRVRYREGSYFKNRALAETWLTDYDVEPG